MSVISLHPFKEGVYGILRQHFSDSIVSQFELVFEAQLSVCQGLQLVLCFLLSLHDLRQVVLCLLLSLHNLRQLVSCLLLSLDDSGHNLHSCPDEVRRGIQLFVEPVHSLVGAIRPLVGAIRLFFGATVGPVHSFHGTTMILQ